MKSLYEYITEVLTEAFIKYDEKKHITGVDFSKLSNEGDNNILNDIEAAKLATMISPDEEEFGYQWMNIYWDKNMIEFYMPNTFTNGSPDGFKFKFKIDPTAMGRFMKGGEWRPVDFKLYQVPASFVKISQKYNTEILKNQFGELLAMVMNRQPEPLW